MPPNFAQRFAELERRVAWLEQRLAFTDPRTYVIGAAITAGMYIPPFHIGAGANGHTLDRKSILGFRGVLQAGTCTIQWMLNGSLELASHFVTAVQDEHPVDLAPAVDVNDGDLIQPIIFDASSDAVGLSATFLLNSSTG